MPRPGPKRPGVSFRADRPVLDEIQACADAASVRLKRRVTRTEIMRARNDFACRALSLSDLDEWLKRHEA